MYNALDYFSIALPQSRHVLGELDSTRLLMMSMSSNNVGSLVTRSTRVTPYEFIELCRTVQSMIGGERRSGAFGQGKVIGGMVVLPPTGKLILIGDLHGDLDSIVTILETSHFLAEEEQSKPGTLLFMGDYGDRGRYSIEVYHVVLSLKSKFPENVVLLRGNHEFPPDLPCMPYDLPYQFEAKFGGEADETHEAVRSLWNMLYHAVLVEDRYLILHGGVPSEARSIEDIARADETHPRTPHLTEILWNDPVDDLHGTAESIRGAGRLFGQDVTERILSLTGAQTLIRGHEPCPGVRVNHGGRVLTIFSSKEPYGLPVAAYVNIALSETALNAPQLAERAVRF